jgi:SAM-dependent methyltransferase
MDRFYEDANSLFVRAYDTVYVEGAPIGGDVAFYGHLARESSGGVLELACGTGRIALALAEAGLEVTGVDISEGMLSVARRKAAARPLSVQQRLTLIQQDMSQLNLGRRFGFAFVPRSLLPAPVDDRSAATSVGGRASPSGGGWPLGAAFVRSSPRSADRREHPMAGTVGH